MQLPDLPLAIIDTETTGVIPRVHHVIEVACMRVEKGKIAEWESLISPPDELPPTIQVLTRISPEMIQGKPSVQDIAPNLLSAIGEGTLLVGQNFSFDLAMLKGDGIDLSTRPWIDTSLLCSLAFPELPSTSLGFVSTVLGLRHDPPHRAMGDVHATFDLLEHITERLLALAPQYRAELCDVLSRSTPGYRLFAEALRKAPSKGKQSPPTLTQRTPPASRGEWTLPTASVGTPNLVCDSLHPDGLAMLLRGLRGKTRPTVIAVKNLDSALDRAALPNGTSILAPAWQILREESVEPFLARDSYLPEEATLALKLRWNKPKFRRDLRLHASEGDVWNGVLAWTEDEAMLREPWENAAPITLTDHRQLLACLSLDPSPIPADAHVIITDASMLEDTATKAFGCTLDLDHLRTAASGNAPLTSLTDLLSLWAEQVRAHEDQHLCVRSDLERRETKEIVVRIAEALAQSDLPSNARHFLTQGQSILDLRAFDERVTWIERARDSGLRVTAHPKRIDLLLRDRLFTRFPTTLLVPYGYESSLPAVTPGRKIAAEDETSTSVRPTDPTFHLSFPDRSLRSIFLDPPRGRSIVLCGSKRVIEQHFVEWTIPLEEKGIELLCMGLSGGMGRMEAEFTAAKDVLWLLTPWMYEGVHVPEERVDRLILDTLPFDHPSQPIFAARKMMFTDGFTQYALPRTEMRLWRILRTFSQHAATRADVLVIDPKLREKKYAQRIKNYLGEITSFSSAF